MDLLFNRYASPFSLLDLMIQSNRFYEFVEELIGTSEDEKLWQMYLSMLSNPMYEIKKSFNDFKQSLTEQQPVEQNKKMTDKEIEATIKHSKEILNSFNPCDKGGDG